VIYVWGLRGERVKWHNFVNMQFILPEISDSIAERMLNLHI